jgi:hypothetical protein
VGWNAERARSRHAVRERNSFPLHAQVSRSYSRAHFATGGWLLLTAGGVLHVPIDAVYTQREGHREFLRARRARFGG